MNEPSVVIPNFLSAIFHDAKGYIVLWTLDNKKSRCFQNTAAGRQAAAKYAESRADDTDVYFGLGLHPKKLSASSRGRAKDVISIGCVWADVDFGPSHASTMAPDETTARRIVESVEPMPSIIVHSGGGLHCYWLFNKPWIIADDEDHAKARATIPAWQDKLREAFTREGYTIDATGDLARILRLPGTKNHKTGDPVPVQLIEPVGSLNGTLPKYARAVFPPLQKTTPPKAKRKLPTSRDCTKYVRAAVDKECTTVASTAQGGRNAALNAASFSLGTLVGGGYIDRDTVTQALQDAARECRLMFDDGDTATMTTINSGLDSGIAVPRTIEDRPTVTRTNGRNNYVLIPGSHKDDDGKYVQQSNYDFVTKVLARMPEDAIYRRDFLACKIVGQPGERHWTIIEAQQMKVLADKHMQLGKWVTSKKKNGGQVMAYQNTSTSHAMMLAGHIADAEGIRDLKLMVSYPVFGPGYVRIKPGWHDGLYYDEPPELRGLKHEHDCEFIHHVLHDLVIDFPFKSDADRQNFFGMLLTPIIAPAIGGDRPMHLINSSLERTGKSKLVNDVWGGVITSHPTPAMQITDREEEREKRIVAMLLECDTLMHLDNLPPTINSPALASLLTAPVFGGRMLGYSRQVNLPNNLTIVGTGNNVQASGEIAKRLIPILMEPKTAKPEARTDFQHPDLKGYVRENRKTVLSCLLGMVDNWVEAGKPKHTSRLGGFEEWSEAIGGILKSNGMSKWRTNEDDWRESANPHGTEIKTFVEIWYEEFLTREVTAKELIEIAEVNGLFNHVFARPGGAGQSASFGKVMTRYVDAPIGEHRIRRRRSRQTLYKLEPIA